MAQKKLPGAVVLDMAYSGYGIIRSLHKYNIPITGIKAKGFLYEEGTRLCQTIIEYNHFEDLLQTLISISESQTQKKVLYITSDIYVYFIREHFEVLSKLFLFDFPEGPTIDILMDKQNFADFALKNNFLIPKTIDLRTLGNIDLVKENLSFPIILKPWLRNEIWDTKIKDKAIVCETYEGFTSEYKRVTEVETSLLAQEYIPGGDESVFYCLVYFNQSGKCISSFTGRKIRQWPVHTGSTASTQPYDDEILLDTTIHFFESLNYNGFGSMEYKKHPVTGNYYAIEPTVGRTDLQQFVATANGINMPIHAYNSLTGLHLNLSTKKKKTIYIDELNELKSALKLYKSGNLSLISWLKSLMGKRAYRYLNFYDPGVGFRLLTRKPLNAIKKLLKRKKSE